MKKFYALCLVFIFASSVLAMPFETNNSQIDKNASSELAEKLIHLRFASQKTDNIFTITADSKNEGSDFISTLISESSRLVPADISTNSSNFNDLFIDVDQNFERGLFSNNNYSQSSWLKQSVIAGLR